MAGTRLLRPDPPGRHLALMVTRRCNMACAHCSVESGPGLRPEPSESELLRWVREAAGAGARSVRLTGGEPMLRTPTVLRLLRECRRYGMASAITTNGFWGRSPARARGQIRALRRAGLDSMVISYDSYHAEFQGPDSTLHIAAAAEDLGLPLRVSLVRGTDERALDDVVRQLGGAGGTQLRVYDLQPVGRARSLPAASHRGEAEGLCSACSFPAVGDDGRVMACNGPAYFEGPESPLVLGTLREHSLAELITRHRSDPILDTIRTSGPAGLRDELRQIPAFANFAFRPQYAGICDLCHHITRDAAAVAALRERLSRPAAAARRLAAWQVLDGQRNRGMLDVGHVNGIGVCRVMLAAALDSTHGFGPGADRVLGRADLDWRALFRYLSGCGLARAVLPAVEHPSGARWAPRFFLEGLQTQARLESLRELVQREVLRQIDQVLGALGGDGVLLDGADRLTRAEDGAAVRSTPAVDVLVDPALAPRLHRQLLEAGFEPGIERGPVAGPSLTPISRQGVGVRLHTAMMASVWGLPEAELLGDTVALPGAGRVRALSPEGRLLHAAVQASASCFAFGLKTAWDLVTVLDSTPALDWDRLAQWVAACRAPRAFWTPVRVLSEELGLPVPAEFLSRAPVDAGARRAALVARHRLFNAVDGPSELDGLTTAGLMLLLQDRWTGRLTCLGGTLRRRGSRPGGRSEAVWRRPRATVRQSWRQYRRYRRALARAQPPVAQPE